MAEIKISDLTPKGANLIATDLLVISEDIGGGLYETKSITGDEVLNAVAKTTVAVRNQTGATIYKGTIVYISGTSGGKALISKAQANSEATSSKTLGVVTADIANNANGNVLTNGLLTLLDTRTTATNPFTADTLAIGDDLYLSPTNAGYVTNVKPIAPNNLVNIGKVLETSATTGQILYAIVNGYELGELHDVDTTGAVSGNVLALNGGIWKPTTISTGLTIGTTPITSGVAGRVLFEGAGNVAQEDAGFLFDSVNKSLTNYGKGGITSNTSFGLNASQSNTTGANNVSIGFESLKNNLTGGFTTAIGYTALRDMTGIGYSTAIGWGAGIGITSGHTNTLLGYGAGSGITTGNNNTIIGVNIASLAAGTLNNVILADGGGNIAIKKDANHFVGIGYSATATLGAKLDVKAQGALSTDIAFRVRNSADTYNILSCYGTELTIMGRNESTEPRLLINRTGGTRMLLGGTTDLSISFPSSGKGEINSGTQGLDIISTSGDIRTRNSSTSTILQGNYFGIGQATPQARLDIKAQGALSTDIAFRVRNSADSVDLFKHNGDGSFIFRNNSNTAFSLFDGINTFQQYAGSATLSNIIGSGFTRIQSNAAGIMGIGTESHIFISYLNGNFQFEEASGILQTSGKGAVAFKNAAIIPSANTIDRFTMYSADIVAGNAAPHFRTENGSVIKLYKQDLPTNPTNAELATFLSNLGLANLI